MHESERGRAVERAVPTLDLVVARHGNTFEPGAPVTWVGRNEDLALAVAGRAQAEALGMWLAREHWKPERALVSSLQRTRVFAELALRAASWSDVPVDADPRLDEVDYGPWGGLTTAQIEARGDGVALAAWSKEGRWPSAFREREEDVRARIERLAEELARATHESTHAASRRVLVVSSNGVMRYFLGLVPGELESRRAARTLKVATGRVCRLRHAEDGWRVLAWNSTVEALELG
jgi:probable phosphoglycerate mutase